MDCSLHFEPRDNFDQEREAVLQGGYHLVYANPYSAVVYAKRLGFIPIAKQIDSFDETLLIARKDFAVDSARRLRIAVASSRLVVHLLGLTLLKQLNIPLAQCDFEFVGTHPKAAQAVNTGADLAFVYRDTWAGLTETTRSTLQVVVQTESHLAFHCFCLAPAWLDKREQLQKVLCTMHEDPRGKPILDDLRMNGLEPLPVDALELLNGVFENFGITPV